MSNFHLNSAVSQAVFFSRTNKYNHLQATVNENRIVSLCTDWLRLCSDHNGERSRDYSAWKTRNKA